MGSAPLSRSSCTSWTEPLIAAVAWNMCMYSELGRKKERREKQQRGRGGERERERQRVPEREHQREKRREKV